MVTVVTGVALVFAVVTLKTKTNRATDREQFIKSNVASAECVTYSTDYYQRITLESWFTTGTLEQTPLNRCQQLPAPPKRLIADNNKTDTIDKPTYLTNNRPMDI